MVVPLSELAGARKLGRVDEWAPRSKLDERLHSTAVGAIDAPMFDSATRLLAQEERSRFAT
jgi:hypothetical protein